MSMRTIARSSSKRKSASDLASSVLPVPVGPRNRNEPVGRLGSAMPARERRTASLTAVTASRWPISRAPMTDSISSSLAVSPWSTCRSGCRSRPRRRRRSARRRPPRRPAARRPRARPASTSAICFSSAGDRLVVDLAGRLEVALAQQLVGLDPQLVERAAQLALALERGLLPLPAGPRARAAPPPCRRGRPERARAARPTRRRSPCRARTPPS